MAPEQALGNPVDQRTDIYAMGVIAYEVFSGSLPFQGESFMGILTQHITTEPEPVAQRAAKAGRQLPLGLAELITRCMRKNPAERFQTMDELVNALIQIYRAVAGAGMSSYLEAFPVGQSAGHNHITPGPMMGYPTGQGAPLGNPQNLPPSGMYQAPPLQAPLPPSGMYQAQPPGPSQSVPAVSPSQSGLYDPSQSAVIAPKKSNAGLIAAILIVLALGGGAAAFVVWNNSRASGGPGAGSGSAAVAITNPLVTSGSGSGTSGSGSAGVASITPPTGSDQGSAVAVDPTAGSGSAQTTVPAGEQRMDVFVETKPFLDKFEIWENGAKVDDDDTLTIVPKSVHNYVLKAKGVKDKPFVVDGSSKKVVVAVERIAPVVPVPPHPLTPVPPPIDHSHDHDHDHDREHDPYRDHDHDPAHDPARDPAREDCSRKLLRSRDPKCRQQFCGTHPDFPACNIE